MKILSQNDSYVKVEVTRDEVIAFKRRWPCSNLPEIPIWVEFYKNSTFSAGYYEYPRGGIDAVLVLLSNEVPYNLVDLDMDGRDHSDCDGAALLALSQDAELFAKTHRTYTQT
jgi:hypothetical protein